MKKIVTNLAAVLAALVIVPAPASASDPWCTSEGSFVYQQGATHGEDIVACHITWGCSDTTEQDPNTGLFGVTSITMGTYPTSQEPMTQKECWDLVNKCWEDHQNDCPKGFLGLIPIFPMKPPPAPQPQGQIGLNSNMIAPATAR
jgi:hypothetical protein